MHKFKHKYVYSRRHKHTRVGVCMHGYEYIQKYTRGYVHVCMFTCIHSCAHSHKQTPAQTYIDKRQPKLNAQNNKLETIRETDERIKRKQRKKKERGRREFNNQSKLSKRKGKIVLIKVKKKNVEKYK